MTLRHRFSVGCLYQFGHSPVDGRRRRDRTPDLRVWNPALSQLSYTPTRWRRGRGSNPRTPFEATRFPGEPNYPTFGSSPCGPVPAAPRDQPGSNPLTVACAPALDRECACPFREHRRLAPAPNPCPQAISALGETGSLDGGEGRNRTCQARRQVVYSHLGVPARVLPIDRW